VNADAPPVLCAHGGFDFAGTYDSLAPLLADAGWRVVCWDQRGHGDSEHAALYSWDADRETPSPCSTAWGRPPFRSWATPRAVRCCSRSPTPCPTG
jgi:pimeloyl-ACP methyl ester carboxylesterase